MLFIFNEFFFDKVGLPILFSILRISMKRQGPLEIIGTEA